LFIVSIQIIGTFVRAFYFILFIKLFVGVNIKSFELDATPRYIILKNLQTMLKGYICENRCIKNSCTVLSYG